MSSNMLRRCAVSAARRVQTSGSACARVQKRFESSSSSSSQLPKQASPHVSVYKNFGRPVTKVLLVAAFTYQLTYWAWVKLEKDDVRATRTAEIERLEGELKDVMEKKKG